MAWEWIIRIILIAIICGITINGYNSGLRGLWLIGYVVLCMAVMYGVMAFVLAVGLTWIVTLIIGFGLALIL